jgi:superfamily II DNA helicase RecQ
MTVEQRNEALARFKTASCGVLIATSALNYSYHAANIQRLFSFSTPKNLMQYSQESRRAGRNGKLAMVRIILALGLPSMARKSGPVALKQM